jgi:uncharacterized protein YaaN involved in tellurite resistance
MLIANPTSLEKDMPQRITAILEILEDGKWHRIDHLRQVIELGDCEIQEITKFLSQYDFAEIDEENGRVRINKDFKKIMSNSAI